MSTITREQLHERAREKVKSLEFAVTQTAFADSRAELEEELELARIALASLEAEAVAWLLSGGGAKNHVSFDSGNAYADPLREVTPLYTTPPAPVSVPDEVCWEDVPEDITEDDMEVALAWEHGFNQCRAAMLKHSEPFIVTSDHRMMEMPQVEAINAVTAMLHGAERVTTAYKLRDAVETIRNSGIEIDAEKIFAERDALNSPVIPDAYDIKAFGIFSATEGENGLMMEVDRFHFETDSCPQVGKDKFVPKFAIQAIINRLQKHCDNMEADALVDVLSTSSAPQQEAE